MIENQNQICLSYAQHLEFVVCLKIYVTYYDHGIVNQP